MTDEELPWQTFHLALQTPPDLIDASIPELRGRGQTHIQMTLGGGESKAWGRMGSQQQYGGH